MLELAIILPILLALTVGIIEIGRLAYFSFEISDAARAGAQYGTQTLGNAESDANVTQAAQNNAQDMPGLAVSRRLSCVCPGTGAVTGGDCGSQITGCSYPLVYLTVTALYTLQPLFHYPGIPDTFNLTGVSTMPVQRQ
jgi:Flp pilus assembly protein TadG